MAENSQRDDEKLSWAWIRWPKRVEGSIALAKLLVKIFGECKRAYVEQKISSRVNRSVKNCITRLPTSDVDQNEKETVLTKIKSSWNQF